MTDIAGSGDVQCDLGFCLTANLYSQDFHVAKIHPSPYLQHLQARAQEPLLMRITGESGGYYIYAS